MESAILNSLLSQGPLVGLLLLVAWWLRKDNERITARQEQKDDERAKERKEEVEKLVKVVEQNTTAWNKVYDKLDQ